MRLISALGGAMVAVLALVMVSCGDSEESQVATTQPAPTTATTTAPEAATTTPPTTATEPITTIAPEAATTTPPTTATEPIGTTTEAPSVDPATALIGTWRPLTGSYLTFQEDDTWSWRLRLALDPSDGGGYAFEDGVLTLTTDVGSGFCPDGEIGIYEVVFGSQDEMAWTAVSDECIDRIDSLVGETIPRYMP